MQKIALLAMTIILAATLWGCAGGEEADKTAPIISGVSASDITQTSATITWTTEEPAGGEVEYGLTTSYGSTALPLLPALMTSQSVTLSDLDENTTYHYRVKSKDESGNEAVSGDYTFTTSKIFTDENLEAAVREAIGKLEGPLSVTDLEGLTELDASEREIANIAGLEYCTHLTTLDLWGNQISDIAFLSSLVGLTGLNLENNQIDNISSLQNLTSLTWLWVGGNQIADATPLRNLVSITDLGLNNNQISDISSLENLSSLERLRLRGNQINDLTPLEGLTTLKSLFLANNQIDDVSPLQGLTNLTTLNVDSNRIADVTPLEGLNNLTNLYLEDNQVTDLTPLVDNEGLAEGDRIELQGNLLSAESINTLIPQLEARGVEVLYDEPLACIAYIYSTDTESASNYELFLEDNDYSVTLVSMENVATTDFSIYDLILVGADTCFPADEWGASESVEAINSSNKSIIGFGSGGTCLFGELGLSINRGNSMGGTRDSIYVVDPTHDIFTSPYSIAVPEDEIIQLYSRGIDCTMEHDSGLAPDVVLLGRGPTDGNHYPLVQEGKYILWGFHAPPDDMTQTGKDLFLNVVDFMLGAP